MAVQKVGSELTVQNTSGGFFFQPAITDLSDGRFAIAWSDTSSGSSWDTRSQVVGSNPGTAFNLESQATINSFNVALDQFRSTTDIAYAWTQIGPTGTERVFHSVISPTGVVRSTAAQVNHTNTSSHDFNPEVVTHADGSYVVAFDSWFGNFVDGDINAVRYDGNGNPLSFNIPFTSINNANNQKDSAIAGLANNRTVLVWSTDTPVNPNPNTYGTDVNGTFGLRAAIFNPDGTQFRDVQLVNAVDMPANAGNGNQIEASVTTLTNGNFVVTWTDTSLSKSDTSGSAIFARVFDANGIAQGSSFQVNTTTAGNQSDSDVVALSGGGFAVSWTDASGATTDIRARAFHADGSASDAQDSVVNTTVAGNQQNSQITSGANDSFMVTWEDASAAPNGTSGQSVRFQLMADQQPGNPQPPPPPPPPPNPPTQPEPPLEVVIRGDDGPNVLVGNALDNEIFGLGGNDTISGLAGNDEIHGGTGRDVLTGNEGQDTFFFDTRPNRSTNWDKITDFRRQDDTIALDDRYFKKLGSSVSNGELRLGTDARDSNDYLIYNRKTGNLYYDADANGSGTKVLIAQFTNKPLLKAVDFDIF